MNHDQPPPSSIADEAPGGWSVRACDPLELSIEGDFHVRGNIKTIVRTAYVKPAARGRKK